MRKLLFFSVLLLTLSCNSEDKTPPNFILFIADDVSWNDLGCYGNNYVNSPNIDRIASQGVRFDNLYLTTSSCSPSRISILSGRYPHNTGAAELHTEPSIKLETMAGLLKDNGYYTAQAGKWHMGNLMKLDFDIEQSQSTENGPGGEALWVSTLKSRDKNKPFFFWFAAHDAHRAWDEHEFTGTHDPEKLAVPPTLYDGPETRKDLAKYYDEIYRFDHYIGQVEKALKEEGVAENTILIIMADNGRPFPRDKTRLYDSGIKTPFIVKWPKGIVEVGVHCTKLVSAIDIAPTVLDLAGLPSAPTFQGRSFARLLNNPFNSFRNFVFAEHNWHDHEAHERMIRSENFLYILNSRPEFPNQGPVDAIQSPTFSELVNAKAQKILTPAQADVFLNPRPAFELYDVKNDPLQINNLAGLASYQDDLNKLNTMLSSWMVETGDDIPVELTKDWYSRDSGERHESTFNQRGSMPGFSNIAVSINEPGPF